MTRPALSEADIVWIARVLFTQPGVGNEPSFTTYRSDPNRRWEIRDAEDDRLPGGLYFDTEADAIQCASALNRLAEHWL